MADLRIAGKHTGEGGQGDAGDRGRAQIDAFLKSIAPDQYAPTTYVPWSEIDHTTNRLAEPIVRLQKIVDGGNITRRKLEIAMREDGRILSVLQYLFASPNGAGFADGREIPVAMPKEVWRIKALVALFFDLGLERIMPRGSNVRQLVQIAALALDSRRRGFRRRETLEARIDTVLRDAVGEVASRLGVDVSFVPSAQQPIEARGRVGALLAVEGVPVAAMQPVIQATSGGRQQRDLALTYPRLQEELDAISVSLILIADGRGLQETPRRVLDTLFDGVASCMTFQQADSGMLADALESAVANRGVRPMRSSSLFRLISEQLTTSASVRADELPIPRDAAVQALARYIAEHDELALRFDLRSGVLNWDDHVRVEAAQRAVADFDPPQALLLLAETLRLSDPLITTVQRDSGTELFLLHGASPPDRVLPETLVLAASREPLEEELVREVARQARSISAEARVAALVSADAAFWLSSPANSSVQAELATSVVVIDASELPTIAGAKSPRDSFVKAVLAQADLTKANPFNYTGVTPSVMFFGRTAELSRVRSSIRSNSIAILGSRRIGKTSLLQRTVDALRTDGWAPFYADCQAAGNWATLVPIISRWGVKTAETFDPAQVDRLIAQLTKKEQKPPVLILDEIDNLLRWDLTHDDGNVPEALFRAFRAVSQEGRARFVFSGERLIAERLWDPASPHWNFCRPIVLRQLARAAADSLLQRPLSELGVQLIDEDEFLEVGWAHTQGHPQIGQFLGDLLVRELNTRAPLEREELTAEDVELVVNTPEFKRHYVTTYWGQATPGERLITSLLAQGVTDLADVRASVGGVMDGIAFERSLRMLELYGIIERLADPLVLRASWMPDALDVFGGPATVAGEERARMQ